jgi:propionyl-CoA carboxylase beta chain
MSIEDKIKLLDQKNEIARLGGGVERVERQHAAGKLTARERINQLFDPETFVELDAFVTHRCTDFGMEKKKHLGDGVITGYGKIAGRQAFVFAQDFTVLGGSLSGAYAEKICKVMDLAAKVGAPMIGLNDGAGARIQEGVVALAGYGEVFARNVACSGVVPQISAIMGPCAGGAVYSPAITDFILMVKKNSYMFITGPEVIKAVTREEVTAEQLGGAVAHAAKTGVADFATEDGAECIQTVRALLSFIPQNNQEDPPFVATNDPSDRMAPEMRTVVPDNPRRPYDVKDLIDLIVDDGIFFEIAAAHAKNIVVGFARFAGHSVGIVANQPKVLAGVLNIDASKKAARFVRFCDSFNIPLVSLVDVPGFLPGVDQEYNGIIKHGAKLLYAFTEATVPRVNVITRKAYGGAYVVMNSKHIGGDISFAFPTAEIAVMGPEAAVGIVFRKELQEAEDPAQRAVELSDDYRAETASPYKAAELGYIDAVIRPEETRPRIISALELLSTKRATSPVRKHGNIPL